MSRLAFLFHPSDDVRATLGATLRSAGFRVVAAASPQEAEERLAGLRPDPPDVVLAPLADGEGANGSSFLVRLRAGGPSRDLPVVVLASEGEDGGADERRKALRLGLTHLLLPPYDGEEAVLTTLLASEGHRNARTLSGSLVQLSVPDLLQTAEANRRSGRIALRNETRRGTFWLRDGRVADAEVEGGPRGREAVYEMALWDHGTFAADFSPVDITERIFEPTSALLLEAMRRRDELLRDASPLHAALPDPPPPPPRPLLTVHRALTLLNIAVSYTSDLLEPELLARRLEETRQQAAAEFPVLAAFRVTRTGAPAVVAEEAAAAGQDSGAVVRGVARWLVRLFALLEHALPGRFSLRRLRSVTEAVQDDLAALGFYRELGLSPESAAGPGE